MINFTKRRKYQWNGSCNITSILNPASSKTRDIIFRESVGLRTVLYGSFIMSNEPRLCGFRPIRDSTFEGNRSSPERTGLISRLGIIGMENGYTFHPS